jgi:hypothetical protein
MPFKPFLVRLLPRGLSEHHVTYAKLQDLVTIQIHRSRAPSDDEDSDGGVGVAPDDPAMLVTTVRMVFAAGADHANIMRLRLPDCHLDVEEILDYLYGRAGRRVVGGDHSLAPVDGVLTVPLEVVVPGLLAMARGLVGFTYDIRRDRGPLGEPRIVLRSEYKVFSESQELGHVCKLTTEEPLTDSEVLAISNGISRLAPGGRFMQLAPSFCYNVARKGLRKIATFDYPSTADLRVNNVERAVAAFNSLCKDRDSQFVQIGDVALRRGYVLTLHFVEPMDFGVILKFDAQQEELMPSTKVPAEVRLFGMPIEDVLQILNGVHESEQRERAAALPLPEDIAARIINMAL